MENSSISVMYTSHVHVTRKRHPDIPAPNPLISSAYTHTQNHILIKSEFFEEAYSHLFVLYHRSMYFLFGHEYTGLQCMLL
jgi:hypothetical protein